MFFKNSNGALIHLGCPTPPQYYSKLTIPCFGLACFHTNQATLRYELYHGYQKVNLGCLWPSPTERIEKEVPRRCSDGK